MQKTKRILLHKWKEERKIPLKPKSALSFLRQMKKNPDDPILKKLWGRTGRPRLLSPGRIHYFVDSANASRGKAMGRNDIHGLLVSQKKYMVQLLAPPPSRCNLKFFSPTRLVVGYNSNSGLDKAEDFFNFKFSQRLNELVPDGVAFLTNMDPASLEAQTAKFCRCINQLAKLLVGRLLNHISSRISNQAKYKH